MDANAATLTTWLDEESFYPYPKEYIKTVIDKHPADLVADVLGEFGFDEGYSEPR